MVSTCEWGGQLAGIVSEDMADPYQIPSSYPRGRYLLLFSPLDGAPNMDVNAPVGTIFSVLRCPEGVESSPSRRTSCSRARRRWRPATRCTGRWR